ncbi:MAG: tRNA dimethylallyltransferase, partial [Firmicutes bacterium]|nr:tRNA dimethylallyltransferase [Bacillota bacterium]
RARYQKKAAEEGNDALYEELLKRDPASAEKISPSDQKRMIRALEILELTGEPKSVRVGYAADEEREFEALIIVLTLDRAQLYERINRRVDRMLTNGLEREVRGLLPYRDCQSMQAIGYKEFLDYFDGRATYPETIELIKKRSRNYAKRQMTYFRGLAQITNVGANCPQPAETSLKYFIDATDEQTIFDTVRHFFE